MTYSGDSYKVTVGDLVDPTKQNAMIDNVYESLNALDTGKANTDIATTSAAGLVEYATNAETQAGTDTTRAVTPAGLKSAVPFKTVAAMNLYVNSGAAYGSWGAGSDSNAGTQAAPFATIAKAIAAIPQVLAHSVSIYLAGSPHYYEWKPDGTNGIKFTTGDSGVTVAVVSGSSLSVAISGSAVTITLASGGSTIIDIVRAILKSSTVCPVIYPIAIGTTSTNITATLTAQAMTGGNVRTYAETVSFIGHAGSGKFENVFLLGGVLNTDIAGVILEYGRVDYPYCLIFEASTSSPIYVTNVTVRCPGVAGWSGIMNFGANIIAENVRLVGPWGLTSDFGGISSYFGTVSVYNCTFCNTIRAMSVTRGGMMSLQGIFGGGNTIGLNTLGGMIFKNGETLAGFAATAESAMPTGSIL